MEEVPVVVHNNAKNVYSLEEEIKQLIDEGAVFNRVNTYLHKLRKYSYQSYIEMNLLAQKTDPKAYHRALQNLISWTIDLDNPSLNSRCDTDASITYVNDEGKMLYNKEARAASQSDWKQEFQKKDDSPEASS